ncbi:hypothetical protein chiPu_0031994 [Chiloscyllium punctatum]|uniref:Uncharacterized protein n=1 Tax=Chiloscyllium punctatum TaxID=137246 RepID=A0A401TZB6_CHIPU|nr:hypothetical protein [Chiloscyllium punctatum]
MHGRSSRTPSGLHPPPEADVGPARRTGVVTSLMGTSSPRVSPSPSDRAALPQYRAPGGRVDLDCGAQVTVNCRASSWANMAATMIMSDVPVRPSFPPSRAVPRGAKTADAPRGKGRSLAPMTLGRAAS